MKTFQENISVDIPSRIYRSFDLSESLAYVRRELQSHHEGRKLIHFSTVDSHSLDMVDGIGRRVFCECVFESGKSVWNTRRAYRQRNRKLWRKT